MGKQVLVDGNIMDIKMALSVILRPNMRGLLYERKEI